MSTVEEAWECVRLAMEIVMGNGQDSVIVANAIRDAVRAEIRAENRRVAHELGKLTFQPFVGELR